MIKPFPFEEISDQHNPAVHRSAGQPSKITTRETDQFIFLPFEDEGSAKASRPDPEPVRYAEEELAAAVEAASKSIEAATERRVREELERDVRQRQVVALEALATSLRATSSALSDWIEHRADASLDLSLALARALIPEALKRQPLCDIKSALIPIIARLDGVPDLELRLPPDLAEVGSELLQKIAQEAGYEGNLRTKAVVGIEPGSAELIWAGGMAQRNLADLHLEIEGLARAWLPPFDPPDAISNDITGNTESDGDPIADAAPASMEGEIS